MRGSDLRAMLERATPGPWGEDDGNIFCRPLADARVAAIVAKMEGQPYDPAHLKFDAFVASTEQRHPESGADAELIAALRNAAPKLIEALEAVEEWGAELAQNEAQGFAYDRLRALADRLANERSSNGND